MLTSTKTTIKGNDLTSVQTYEIGFKKGRLPRKLKKELRGNPQRIKLKNLRFYTFGMYQKYMLTKIKKHYAIRKI